MFNDLKKISLPTLLFRWSITVQLPLFCGCHWKTSAGTVLLTFFYKSQVLLCADYMTICVSKFVDIERGLLELFENVSGVWFFFETQCRLPVAWVSVMCWFVLGWLHSSFYRSQRCRSRSCHGKREDAGICSSIAGNTSTKR